MSSIMIRDLAHSARLDSRSMAGVRGGAAWSSPDVRVNVNVSQQIAQYQQIGVNVLNNNGVIGAGFEGPKIALSPSQWAQNQVVLPRF
jgi:hypothetical protein